MPCSAGVRRAFAKASHAAPCLAACYVSRYGEFFQPVDPCARATNARAGRGGHPRSERGPDSVEALQGTWRNADRSRRRQEAPRPKLRPPRGVLDSIRARCAEGTGEPRSGGAKAHRRQTRGAGLQSEATEYQGPSRRRRQHLSPASWRLPRLVHDRRRRAGRPGSRCGSPTRGLSPVNEPLLRYAPVHAPWFGCAAPTHRSAETSARSARARASRQPGVNGHALAARATMLTST